MLVSLNFDADLWVTGVEITTKSEEEAKRKLLQMDIEDLISEGVIKDFSITDITTRVLEKHLVVEVSNLVFDEDDTERAKDIQKTFQLDFDFDYAVDSDIEDAILDEINYIYDITPISFDYKIISED